MPEVIDPLPSLQGLPNAVMTGGGGELIGAELKVQCVQAALVARELTAQHFNPRINQNWNFLLSALPPAATAPSATASTPCNCHRQGNCQPSQ
jgi:hypothetical protein